MRLRTTIAAALLIGSALTTAGQAVASPAVGTGDFRLAFSNSTYSDKPGVGPITFQGVVNGLSAVGLFKVPIDDMNLNRSPASGCYQNVPASVLGQICWDAGDNASTEWYPQGITTSNDAAGGAPSTIVASWYDNCSTSNHDSPGCTTAPTDDRQYSKGVRLSVFDTNTNQYRLVLLVEPFVNASGNWTYKTVKIHAGGIAWYGRYLYVADTTQGIRVFDTWQLFDMSVSPTEPLETDISDKNQIGRQNGVFYTHGYRYVMPQVGRWKQSTPSSGAASCPSSGPAKYSYLALDRTSSPDRLVAGEYCDEEADPTRFGRVARYDLASSTSLSGGLATSGGYAQATDAYRLPVGHVQGAVSAGSTFWFNKSAGSQNEGTMWRHTLSGGALSEPGTSKEVVIGCEDLSYDTTTGRVYSLSEYLGARMTYYTSG